ncbi:hypothetical protein ACQQ2Q_19395 [Agrobacterium sp. ES01]|uniref:hypothetical protein n=1 Tax=Agrobacterium sp. ES01 TaxID=3420714 RepID=UPI003D14FAEF
MPTAAQNFPIAIDPARAIGDIAAKPQRINEQSERTQRKAARQDKPDPQLIWVAMFALRRVFILRMHVADD